MSEKEFIVCYRRMLATEGRENFEKDNLEISC
jgi:hypothetical protein